MNNKIEEYWNKFKKDNNLPSDLKEICEEKHEIFFEHFTMINKD